MFSIYSGTADYQKGEWSKDEKGNKIVVGSDDVSYLGRYTFKGVVAVSMEQLNYKLCKQIKEEKKYDFPIYIDSNDIKASFTGYSGNRFERFDNLLTLVGR